MFLVHLIKNWIFTDKIPFWSKKGLWCWGIFSSLFTYIPAMGSSLKPNPNTTAKHKLFFCCYSAPCVLSYATDWDCSAYAHTTAASSWVTGKLKTKMWLSKMAVKTENNIICNTNSKPQVTQSPKSNKYHRKPPLFYGRIFFIKMASSITSCYSS